MRLGWVVIFGVMLMSVCVMCHWLVPAEPMAIAAGPDESIVRSAAERFLGVRQLTVLDYQGNGGAGDSLWWARIQIPGAARQTIESKLKAFAREKNWMYAADINTGELIRLKFTPPPWWTPGQTVYSIRTPRDAGGFFATPTETAGEWCVMEYGR